MTLKKIIAGATAIAALAVLAPMTAQADENTPAATETTNSQVTNQQSVPVVYHMNGGSINGVSGDGTVQVPAGQTILDKLPTAVDLQRDGYKFAGWTYTDGTPVQSGDVAKLGKDYYEVQAQWTSLTPEQPTATYNIIVSTNGGTVQNGENAGQTGDLQYQVKEGTNLLSVLPKLKRDGFVFVAWHYADNAGTQVGAQDTVKGNVTVYATWNLDKVDPGMQVTTHTVVVRTNGGTVQDGEAKGQNGDVSITVGDGDNLLSVLPSLKRDGFVQRGWYYGWDENDNQSYGTSTKVGESDTVTKDLVVRALWDVADPDSGMNVKTYDVTVKTKGGVIDGGEFDGQSGDVKFTAAENDTLLDKLPKLKRDGYTFRGWHYEDVAAHGTNTTVKATDTVTGDVTVIALWDVADPDSGMNVKTYDVTVKTKGGVIDGGEFDGQSGDVKFTAAENDTLLDKLPKLKRDGYTFRGWHYEDVAAHGTNTTVKATDTVTGDVTVIALWDVADPDPDMNVEQFTVVYNTNGGNINGEVGDFSVQVAKGDTILDKLPTTDEIVRDGYKLSGWQYAETGTDKDGSAVKATDTATGNVYKIVAQWTKVAAKGDQSKTDAAAKADAKKNDGAILGETGSAIAGVAVFALVALAGAAAVMLLRKRA
ncbi:InlB B-repeat-containing protein [Bifidobacterium parmae]|uniref:Cell wall/surface repeat-containing protein n=1 Tax=Bifidobacterium parmae TaxID=361854 RepID=A0A2N5J5X5_9BIFI|nr:InlB B-repeat-containing protein [Bifidobacterium parmae]PLS29619.1 cell wall/surface repeat-containing protein [Bifidobacterium parmae]